MRTTIAFLSSTVFCLALVGPAQAQNAAVGDAKGQAKIENTKGDDAKKAEAAAKGTGKTDGAAAPSAPTRTTRLYVRDGQLVSHIFTVLVTDVVDETMNPKLYLTGSHWMQRPLAIEMEPIAPLTVAPRQTRTMMVNGQQVSVEGTLLIFDLNKYSVHWYKSAVRLLPRLEWTVPASIEGQSPIHRIAVAEQEIYLGNMTGASLWTAAIMLLVTVALLVWSKSKSENISTFRPNRWLLLVTGPDGYLSLWRTQLMLWTYAVGSLVFLFGLLRLKVPEIPDSLVALMGMSLLTGLGAKVGAGNSPGTAPPVVQPTAPVQPADPSPALQPNQRPLAQWSDLVSTWNSVTNQVELSVPKAQMVIWTAVIVTLFCVKSWLDGTLWEVPWQMVALTGFSQAGYVGDKFIKGQP